MDSYRQDSACNRTSRRPDTHFRTLTPDETVTYRRWRNAVLALYCSLLVLGGLAALIAIPVSNREMAQVSSPPNIP